MQAGDIFNDKYHIEEILGMGGMGTVYLARNIDTGRHWAVKEICRHQNDEIDPASEPNLLKKLDHPAFPRLYDIVRHEGKLYMITDYIKGVSLDKKLEAESRIPEKIVVNWAIQLCRALEYLHSMRPNPVIYRDIKPSNIMLTDTDILKLVDFGSAREYKPQSDADTVYIGTRGYAAPEQFGTGQTSAASDIYSLGVTLHHLLTGKSPVEPPYRLEPIRYYDPGLSPKLEAIIARCTHESISERYQSASELLADLYSVYLEPTADEKTHSRDAVYREDSGMAGLSTESNRKSNKKRNISSRNDRKRPEYKPEGKPVYGPEVRPEYRLKAHLKRKPEHKSKIKPEHKPEIKPEHKPEVRSFRRLVITVWDNAEFGCELAYTAARFTGGEVLLADIDLLAPKADLILNVPKYPHGQTGNGITGRSGLDIVMDAAGRGALIPALLRQASSTRKDMRNLYVITGNYRLDNYEYYSEDSVPQLIDICYRNFDVTVLLVNRSIYDAFTMAALLRSDCNIIAVRGEIGILREFNTYIAFLNEKQHLAEEKTMFILYEHDKSTDMSEAEVRQASRDNLLGSITYSRKRVRYRNMKSSYVSHMEKNILNEYYRIHERLGLMPATGLFPRLRQLLDGTVGGIGHQKTKASEG